MNMKIHQYCGNYWLNQFLNEQTNQTPGTPVYSNVKIIMKKKSVGEFFK